MGVRGSVRRRLATPWLAALLFLAAAVVPPAAVPVASFLAVVDAPVARAADGLAVDTTARYTVVPDEALVRVSVVIRVRNERPNSVEGGLITSFYYDVVKLAVQPEATNIRATQEGVAVPVQAGRRRDYRLVTISLREDLYYRERATVRLSFDLPSGRPRSESGVRVGRAFAAFVAWAFGDQATVRVAVPSGFEVNVAGADMATASEDSATVLTAETADPLAWYAWVTARNDDQLTRERLELAGGEQVLVRGWPEDERWRARVGDVLSEGIPELVALIGLPWPVDGPLAVVEVHSPLLEGYAGFYNTEADEITVSEQLDDQTIVHEASHAWFNGTLFAERWVNEGLADEYAARVLDTLGKPVAGPDEVSRTAEAAFPLAEWPAPAAIRGDDQAARERYGYDASWTVIRRIVDAVGEDGMRAVFESARDRTTAYVGEGPPERAALPNDWRRLLDLTEELGGAENVDDLVAEWALDEGKAALLSTRDAARDAYHELLAEGGGWAAPVVVRLGLDGWAFAESEARIAEARAILAQRRATERLADAAALAPPSDLEVAYEAAAYAPALAAAADLGERSHAALEAIVEADEAVAAPRDWLVTLGLDGRDPEGDLAAARDAWEAGDPAAAADLAADAAWAVETAPESGRRRALVIGAGVAVVVLLALLIVLFWRRRSRSRRRPPEGPDPYATLG